MGISVEFTEWLFSPLSPGRVLIRKCWLFVEEGKPEIPEKNVSDHKLNPQKSYDSESGNRNPGHIGGEASALITVPSLLPNTLNTLLKSVLKDT